MTSHISNDELLWDYLHELLDAPQVSEVEAHLAGCGACQQALEVARADCANLAAATRLDGPFPLFETPDESALATLLLRPAWSPVLASRWQWAAAAAVLVAVGLPFIGFRMGVLQRTRAVEQADTELVAAREQRDSFRQRIERDQAVALGELQARHPLLQVHGPAAYQPDQANVFRVHTTDLAGHKAPARLTARLIQDRTKPALFEKQLSSDGDALIELPPLALPRGSKAELEFVADGRGDRIDAPEMVRGKLEVRPTPQATHLALEKYLYRPGDKILFRSITLDRSTWKPDAAPFAIRYELTGPTGKQMLDGTTREGGIGGGAFNLPAKAAAGVYQLTAADADGRFAPVTRTMRVVTAPLPPAHLDDIRFFPEGGNLIADVPTRVYFTARDNNDDPIDVEGAVVNGKQEPVLEIQSAGLQGKPHLGRGRGSFVLTPKKGEAYYVRPKNATAQATIYALPKVHEVGLGLALTNPVIRPGEPIRSTVHAVGERLPVVVGVFVHGKLVAQHPVTLHRGANSIELPAPADLAGVFRVALFPAQTGAYQPIAESVGFCRKATGLSVAWETVTKEGKRFLRVRNGAGTPEKSWFAVSVQPADDPVAIDHARSNALWTGLVLRNELPRSWPEDNLVDLLRDDPAMVEALGLYLGLQGPMPRNLQAKDPRPALVMNDGASQGSEALAMLNLDNADSVRTKIASGLASQFRAARLQEHVLAEQEELAQARTAAARLELEGYQERASALFRPLLGLLVVSLFAAGCIGLTMAIWRTIGHQAGARNWVLTSGGALAACLVFVALSPFQIGALPGAQSLDPLAELAFNVPQTSTQIAMDQNSSWIHPVNVISGAHRMPIVDRSKPLPVAAVQAKSLWLPAIASNDGACEIELTAPPGKLGHVLHIDVFTASGRVGSTTALLAP